MMTGFNSLTNHKPKENMEGPVRCIGTHQVPQTIQRGVHTREP